MKSEASNPRTKERAFEVLLENVRKVAEDLEDSRAASVMSEDLVRGIFESAWTHQFDNDRSGFIARARELVQLEIESQKVGESRRC